jgi:hypothetical protein
MLVPRFAKAVLQQPEGHGRVIFCGFWQTNVIKLRITAQVSICFEKFSLSKTASQNDLILMKLAESIFQVRML